MKNYIKRLFCLLSVLVLLVGSLDTYLVCTFADSNTYPFKIPEGYYVHKTETNSDGNIVYYLISTDYNYPEVTIKEVKENTEGDCVSFSPQMTYSFYDGNVPINELETALEAEGIIDQMMADPKVKKTEEGLLDLNKTDQETKNNYLSLINEVAKNLIDKSSAVSNSFCYSGVPDHDSWVGTCYSSTKLKENEDGIMDKVMSFLNYTVAEGAGLNDWYVALHNTLGWSNLYDNPYNKPVYYDWDNYKDDYLLFGLLNWNNYKSEFNDQLFTNNWTDDKDVAIKQHHMVQFQSVFTSIICSGLMIFDVATMNINEIDLLSSFADASITDVLSYGNYKALHSQEDESIVFENLRSPVASATLKDNTLTVNIRENYEYKIGYYVDYICWYGTGCDRFKFFRKYFYPSDDKWNLTNKLEFDGSSLECILPFTTCDYTDYSKNDNCLIKGIGFFGYELDKNVDYEVAKYAPTRTAGLGDISFCTSYTYLTLSNFIKDKEHDKFYYDWNDGEIEVPTLVYVYDPKGNPVDVPSDPVKMPMPFSVTIPIEDTDFGKGIKQISDGTFIYVDIDNTYIENKITNLTNISDDDKVKIRATKDTSSDSSSENNKDSEEYWSYWTKWIKDCKEFIGNVPSLLSELWSWLPDPLPNFIILSIASGFGIAVIHILLNKK